MEKLSNKKTLGITESREFFIFQAFANNQSYDEALGVIEAHDRDHPEGKILASAVDKLYMKESYKLFREASRPLYGKGGLAPDYDNPQVMERLKNIIKQKLPPTARDVLSERTGSVTMNQANIGRMLAVYAGQLKALGKKALNEQKRQAEAKHYGTVATTDRSGRVSHGGYGKGIVFSDESKPYKTTSQILQDRIRDEKGRFEN